MDLGIELQRKCCCFAEDNHPIFRGTSVLERGELRSKESGKKSIHFNGSTLNLELLLQMVISINQLSIFGAVADMIEKLPVGQRAVVKTKAPGQLDKVEILTQLSLAEMQANEERQGNLLHECERRFEKLSEDQKLSKLCSECKFEISRNWTIYFVLFRHQEEKEINLDAENTRCLEIKKELVSKGGSKAMYDLAQSRT